VCSTERSIRGDVIALVVLWRLRYKLSLRDLAEMFLTCGLVFSYEAVRDWEAKLTPALAQNLQCGIANEGLAAVGTLMRPISGCVAAGGISIARSIATALWWTSCWASIVTLLAARAFFRSAKAVTGVTPDRVTPNGHDAYPSAIRTELGESVRHRTNRYLNNRLEQDHRGITHQSVI